MLASKAREERGYVRGLEAGYKSGYLDGLRDGLQLRDELQSQPAEQERLTRPVVRT